MSKRSISDTGSGDLRKSARLNILDIFPSCCYFCKNVRKRVGGKLESCHVLSKPAAETVLHNAIRFHKDSDLLLYIDNDASLRERKFQMHKSCYRKYVKPVYSCSSRVEQSRDENEDHCAEDGSTTEQAATESEGNNFDTVSDYIEKHIVNSKEGSVSISYLHEMYADGHAGDRRFRGKLKTKINEKFGAKVKFVSEGKKTPEMIVNGDVSAMTNSSKRNILNLAADYMRQDILHMSSNVSRSSWPPSKDELENFEKSIPHSITSFYNRVLHPGTKHEIPDSTKVLVNSFSSDLLYSVSKGDILPKKHFYLAMGLHNMTGQKTPVTILSNLGHCDSYDNVCINETAQALLAQEELKNGKHLKIQPNGGSCVNTIYWADNFNMAHDTMGDKAFIDITNVVAFQEVNADSFMKDGSKRSLSKQECMISQLEVISIDDVIVNKRIEPRRILNSSHLDTCPDHLTKCRIYWWIVLRFLSANDQSFPSLSGWLMLLRSRSNTNIKKTEETYLPPLPTSIGDFGTLQKLFEILQDNAKSVNMQFVNLTLDVGAAINAYKLLWNYSLKYSNIMIHLGDFHFMKENFGVIGVFIKNSGFEDIVFQSRLCTSGCLNGILSGGHYNRCWGVHSCFYEALERLLFAFFKQTYEIDPPKEFQPYLEGETFVPDMFSHPIVQDFFMKYEVFKQDIRDGEYGKTAQFWMVYYIDIMFNQHVMHTAVQENDFENRLHSWRFMLSYFFATNKTNYSRYGAYYVFSLDNIDKLYPGNKDLLKESGLSIQSQARYDLRTPVDQRGEQTVNREGKVSGGLKLLRPDDKVMLKWILNRSKQAENTSELKAYAKVKQSEEIYKHIRPSQVIKSEKSVQRVLDVLQNEYLNPFDPSLERSKLYNLSSGVPVTAETDDSILSVLSGGQEAYNEFVTTRLQTDGQARVHDTITRKKYVSFSTTSNRVTVVKCGKEKTIESNRDVLGQLIATSTKHNQPIDFEKALSYQLTAVPLSLAHPDGSRRTTSKSLLIDVIKQFNHSSCSLPSNNEVSAYVVDFIALARTVTAEMLPETFKEYFDVLLGKIPAGYKRVDIIVDAYLDKSFKNEERIKRGVGEKVIVASEHSKLPRNFKVFLSNGDNKSRLAELLVKVMLTDRAKILSSLLSEVVYVSTYNKCVRISMEDSSEAYHLTSNQEEADTKLMLHANDALSTDRNTKVIIRSHSGDTDILVLAIGLFIEEAHRVVIDTNTGKDRLVVNLGNINMSNQQKQCLIPLHALSGNDYTSSFFRRSKIRFWDTLQSNVFFEIVSALGNSWEVPEEVYKTIEEYICFVYGRKTRKVNEVRYSMFQSKLKKGGKVIDLSILPPCQTVLRLLIQRTNMVARIWKVCKEQPVLPQLNASDHAWDNNYRQKWSDVIFPDDVTDLVVDVDLENYDAADDVCSDEEDEI